MNRQVVSIASQAGLRPAQTAWNSRGNPHVSSDPANRLPPLGFAQYNLPSADSAVRQTCVLWYILPGLGTLFRGTMREETCGNLEPFQSDAGGNQRSGSFGTAYAPRLPNPASPTPLRPKPPVERPSGQAIPHRASGARKIDYFGPCKLSQSLTAGPGVHGRSVRSYFPGWAVPAPRSVVWTLVPTQFEDDACGR